MHPRTIMVVFASIWAAFYGAPCCLDCAPSYGARAPGTRCPVVRCAPTTRPIDTKGPGWKILGSLQRCTRSRRRPGSPGGAVGLRHASGSRARPAKPTRRKTLTLPKIGPAWPLNRASADGTGAFQHKVSCSSRSTTRSKKHLGEPGTASGAAFGGRQRRLHRRPRSTPLAAAGGAAAGALRAAADVDIECRWRA